MLTSVTGNVDGISPEDRRINGITFDAETGAFSEVTGSDAAEFTMTFGHDTAIRRRLSWILAPRLV